MPQTSVQNRLLLRFIFGIAVFSGFEYFVCCKETRGFILTAPNTLHVNSIENVCLSLHNISQNGTITINLSAAGNGIASTSHSIIRGKSICFEFAIPLTPRSEGIIKVTGNFDGIPYIINGEAAVKIKKVAVMTFIETDKQMYKPGQKVLFRIFRLTNQLLPVLDPVPEVWIENPLGVRIAQWMNPEIDKGITDLSFELTDEPILGIWHIRLRDASDAEQTFHVQEYVLPKFEVTISTPTVLLADYNNFTLKICAHYTYGKPVNGRLSVEAKMEHVRPRRSRKLWGIQERVLYNNSRVVLDHGCCEMTVFNTIKESMIPLYHQNGAYSINVYAEVIEHGTETKMNNSKTQVVFYTPFTLEFKSKSYFKPGMPYFGKFLVKYHDGSPVANESIIIEAESHQKTFFKSTYISNQLGEVNYILETQGSNADLILIQGYVDHNRKLGRVAIRQSLKSWYSPSQSFLQIKPFPRIFSCDAGEFGLHVNFTMEKPVKDVNITFYYQIMARGKFLLQKETQHSVELHGLHSLDSDTLIVRSVILPIPVLPNMSPLAHLLVYYVRDVEIVSDSQEIVMEDCFQNKVNMSFDKDEILPATSSSIIIEAYPQSICALNVVDKSAHLLATNNLLNIEKVFASINKAFPKLTTQSTRQRRCPIHQRYGISRYRSRHYDSLTDHKFMETDKAFNDMGLVTISDFVFEVPPCPSQPRRWSSPYRFKSGPGARGRADSTEDTVMASVPRRKKKKGEKVPQLLGRLDNDEMPQIIESSVEIRDHFPETWLWELHHIGNNGSMRLNREIPHSITTWVGTTLCISEQKGFGVSQQNSIRAFQAFFLSFTMPYSVKNGEVVPLIVSVFNYLSECIPVKIFIEESDAYAVVNNSSQSYACVCGQTSHYHTFWIRPSSIGSKNVTVHAHSVKRNISKICKDKLPLANVMARDAVTKPVLVEAQGFPKEFTNTSWLCPHEHPEQTIVQDYDLMLPRDVVKGSERAFVSIIGDLMGPTVQGLDGLVRLPVGCGEQNMVLFAPNIYVLQYLNNSNQLTDKIQEKAINHLKTGYQRQLNYKHLDGSYSAFGGKDSSGSIWLTAFVIKSFAQAKPFIYIDPTVLEKSVAFIHKNQMNNGCFKATGKVLSKSMQGGLGSDTSEQSLAAYILIALLEADIPTQNTNTMLVRAFECLEENTKNNTYLLAMKAYAAALSKKNVLALSYINQLKLFATRKGNMLYWTKSDGRDSLAMDIEITSYTLLSLVTLNSHENKVDALSIVRWLTKQRNAYGGFVSTQDTILALQALAKYASLTYAGNVSLELELIESNEMESGILEVNDANKLVLQTQKIPSLPTYLVIGLTGEGCAMVQLTMKYNILNDGPKESFYLAVRTSQHPKFCSIRVDICTRYKLPDGQSNMVVIEVQMLSGFEADSDSLDELQNDINVQLKRWENPSAGTTNLYFDELTNVTKCFGFNAVEKFKVKESKPAIVKVYDYYEPELTVSQNYTLIREVVCDEVKINEGTIY